MSKNSPSDPTATALIAEAARIFARADTLGLFGPQPVRSSEAYALRLAARHWLATAAPALRGRAPQVITLLSRLAQK